MSSNPHQALALLTTDEMYRADRLAMDAGISGIELMENAGRAVAEAALARGWKGPALVLCGPGNNGGDGFVAARHLAGQGLQVCLALLGARSSLKGDAAHHAALWSGEVVPLSAELVTEDCFVIDALFGAGLERPITGAAADVLREVRRQGRPVCAVDVPSGLSGDTGKVLGDVICPADLTIIFFRKKPGHLLDPGAEYCGEVQVADIGIPELVLDEIRPQCWENGPGIWLGDIPRRTRGSHKFQFGHLLISAGRELAGAAILASRGALRVGAGLVTVACTQETRPIILAASPSVMTAVAEVTDEFQSLLDEKRLTAFLLGPGAGATDETRQRVRCVLGTGSPVLLDADALSAFKDAPEDLLGAIAGPCLMTPHEGEFARVFPDVSGSKLCRARSAAAASRACLLLKGADTVIAAPDGRALINGNAPPHLATAGAGDVLAGFAAGLLAQGMTPFAAAGAAAWLHGAAAEKLGPGMIAEDLTEVLPAVLSELLAS